ncbi:MAG: hypothetical protein M1825_003520 [Sarcosagium campestre]|nr:MAG: hypothetical protein M1825_003520 [Sarcosagium campestre]
MSVAIPALVSRRLLVACLIILLSLILISSFGRPTFPIPGHSNERTPNRPVENTRYDASLAAAASYASASPAPLRPLDKNDEIDRRCDAVPDPGDILMVIKTGATEAYEKLPVQLMTTLKCSKDFLIFSNMDQYIGPYHLRDALADVPPSLKANNNDFELYEKLQEYQASGRDPRELKGYGGDGGWRLDKYKFLPMIEQTYRLRPDKNWYVFMETDTYVVWTNLVQWLGRMNASEPLYLGAPSYINNLLFGHGGSGYILSRGAMEKFVGGTPPGQVSHMRDDKIKDECCGDFVLARALDDSGIPLTRHWPMINNEKPHGMPYGDNWCQPLITMHHLTPEDVSKIWRFEQARPDQKSILLIEDLYRFAMQPHLTSEREDWFNDSDDQRFYPPGYQGEREREPESKTELEEMAWRSFDDCKNACKAREECFQFVYDGPVCAFSDTFKLGQKKMPEGSKTSKSGWDLDKIRKFVANNSPCKEPQWVPGT